MKYFWVIWFFAIFHLQFCFSSYIFTQEKGKTYVCKTSLKAESCSKGVIFQQDGTKNLGMNLGFINSTSAKFHDDYDMSKFGFPIFYETFPGNNQLKIYLIIATGQKSFNGEGSYYYVSLIDKYNVCGVTKPETSIDTLAGALYLNQKYAKYAYYIYQSSSSSTCIISIKFEDLFQGNYATKEFVLIEAKEIHLVKNKVENYIHPFFTIDPIFGTMVYLVKNGIKLSAIHYKIDENDLTNVEKVFSIPLSFDLKKDAKTFFELFSDPENLFDNKKMFPSFINYGKSIYLFFMTTKIDYGLFVDTKILNRFVTFWPSTNKYEEPLKESANSQRHLCYLDSDSFENGEPVGKLISTPSSEIECSGNFVGWFITFAIIDFLLMIALLCLGLLIFLGSKKMKKLRKKNNINHGNQTIHGETTFAAVTGTTVGGGGQTTVAPTDLNTQFTKATTVGRTGAGETTNVTMNGHQQQQTTNTQAAGSAPVGTTARKTTMLQTWT